MRSLVSWLNRGNAILLMAFFTLVIGVIWPWYILPKETLEVFGVSLTLANSIRFFVVLPAILGLIVAFFYRNSSSLRLLFWSLFIGVLLYPYFIVTWSPTVAFLAKAYYEQGERVTLHIESNFYQVQFQWKQNINLAQSRPLESIFGLSIKDSRFFQLASWEQLLREGFGYSNSFFNSLGRGWILTVMGIAIALIALYLQPAKAHLDIFVKDCCKFLPFFSLLIGLITLSIIAVNIVNYQLEGLYAKGEYSQVVTLSKSLASWYPPLQGDESFLKRAAKSGFYTAQPDPALIAFVQGLERYHLDDYDKAVQYFQQAIDLKPKLFLARGYLATTILNKAVDYFQSPFVPNRPLNARFPYKYNFLDSPRARESVNNSKPSLTAEHCQRVLEIFPNHLEALYDLMLVRVVNGEFNKSAAIAQKIIKTKKYFQQPMLALLGQSYLHLSWNNYQKNELPQAWLRYRQSIDPKTWKTSSEVEP
jgi:tetratricopeptide (TPR) repeat protein